MPKSRELASERAKDLADEATAKGGTLQEIVGSTDEPNVVETDSFSYLTIGSALDDRGFLRLSEVDGVEGASNAFLDKAFELKPGDVDVAANHPQTFVYVIRLAGREKPLSELHEEFMRSVVPGDPLSFQLYQQLSQSEGTRAVRLLQRNIAQEMDFRKLPQEEAAPQ